MSATQTDLAKQAVGYQAAMKIKDGMRVGIGTGSTAKYFIERLGQRCQEGLSIEAVATSIRSHELAHQAGIPLVDFLQIDWLDITVDGADEIDSQFRMIKGGGGALLREKIVATASHSMLVIVDASKVVEHLGSFPLPVEIVPFAHEKTCKHLENKGYKPKLRLNGLEPFVTDGGHYIYDIYFQKPLNNPESVHHDIIDTVGVVETGFFFGLAKELLVGYQDGRVEQRTVST